MPKISARGKSEQFITINLIITGLITTDYEKILKINLYLFERVAIRHILLRFTAKNIRTRRKIYVVFKTEYEESGRVSGFDQAKSSGGYHPPESVGRKVRTI